MKRTILALLAAAGLLLALVATAGATGGATTAATKKKAKTVTIKVADNYYTPPKTKIKVGDTLKFQWPEFSDTHDVNLNKGDGPKGAKTFESPDYGGSDAVWKKKFTVAGTYKLVCSFHDTMTMVVKVSK
jgi:plastocyanin